LTRRRWARDHRSRLFLPICRRPDRRSAAPFPRRRRLVTTRRRGGRV